MENGRFIVDVPIENGAFPQLCKQFTSVQCGLFCHMLELHQSNQKGGYAVPAINHPCHISRNEWVATQSRLDVFHVPQTSSQRKMNVFQNGGGTPKIIHV